jgi:uncharacterized protein YwgA
VDSKTLVLLFLFARGKSAKENEPIPTLTHLQKEIFVLTRKGNFKDIGLQMSFVPLWYGPFSKELVRITDELVESGEINADENVHLTSDGFKKAAKLWKNLNEYDRIEIIRTKEELNRMKLDDLLEHVYSLYPKFTVKSALRKDVVDKYFADFCREHNITEDYVIEASLRIRYGGNEEGSY